MPARICEVEARSGSNAGRMAALRSGYYSRFDAIVTSASGASSFSDRHPAIHEQTSALFDRSFYHFGETRGIFTISFRALHEHNMPKQFWPLLKEVHSARRALTFRLNNSFNFSF